jgi:predicted phage baseplate assembly protein
MPLPSPNLDDRSFQDLVDDAKRLVQRRCPEWTDHNVSDPGVTLIETFAYMVDQLLWRLNRVPDRLYTRFLDLIGLQLFPPSPARAPVTFWLSAPQPTVVSVPALTKVQTARSSAETPPISFSTLEQLDIVPCHRSVLGSQLQASGWQDWTDRLRLGRIQAFSSPPEPGDALLVGLSDAVPRCAVALQISCQIEGIGVDPDNPPLVWEAFDGQHWTPCELERDTTGGLNRAGEIVLHVPASHAPALLNGIRAGWLRGRVCQAELDQPSYSHSPFIERLDAATVGGTTGVIQAEIIEDEILGISDGVPAQTFEVAHRPMVALPGEPTVLEVSDEPEGWQEWTLVDDFARSGPEDRHFTLDPTAGEIRLGPAVRLPEGNVHQHGAVPPKGAVLRLRRYASGGGASGNVARGAISVLQGTIPFIASVENRQSASGGVDGETVEEAKARGPVELRTLRRAVTSKKIKKKT